MELIEKNHNRLVHNWFTSCKIVKKQKQMI